MAAVATISRASDRVVDRLGRRPTADPAQPTDGVEIVRTERDAVHPGRARVLPPSGTAVSPVRLVVHGVALFVTVLATCLACLGLLPALFGYRSVVVTSGSMRPSLDVADVVVTDEPSQPLPVGAVIDYEVDGAKRIHRVVEVLDDSYRTKGDANPTPDPQPVPFDDVDGQGILVVPLVGAPAWLAGSGRWVELGLATAALGVLGRLSSSSWLAGGGWTGWRSTRRWLAR